MLGCIRFWLLAPVTGVVRSSVTRDKGGIGSEKLGKWSRRCRVGGLGGARVQPIQVAAASNRRRARQRDMGLRGRGLGVLGCIRFRFLTPVTGNVRSSERHEARGV